MTEAELLQAVRTLNQLSRLKAAIDKGMPTIDDAKASSDRYLAGVAERKAERERRI